MEQLTMTVEECAALLGINRMTAYQAVHAGELPAIKIGRRFLIPKAAFERLLASAEQQQKNQHQDISPGGTI
jgi:excisionase family DNA binding protein